MKALLLLSLLSLQTYAVTVEEAKDLYATRESQGEGLERALQSAKAYQELAASENDSAKKAELLIAASRGYYFYANHLSDDGQKEALHGAGKNIAQDAINSAKQVNDLELEARATYQYGANLGKWAEARGIGSSLGQWPALRDSMERIYKELKQPQVDAFGAYRVLGRAYFKLPGLLGGSNKKSLQFLTKANQSTINAEAGISSNPTNITYLAEVMIDEKQKSEARDLLTKFINFVNANGAEKLNADLVPEIKDELANAQRLLNKI